MVLVFAKSSHHMHLTVGILACNTSRTDTEQKLCRERVSNKSSEYVLWTAQTAATFHIAGNVGYAVALTAVRALAA